MAAGIIENHIAAAIKPVQPDMMMAVKLRVLAVEEIKRELDDRFRTRLSYSQRSRWHEHIWGETWYLFPWLMAMPNYKATY